MTICFQRKKWVLHVLQKCVDLCWICAAVKFCLIGPVALCSSPAPVNSSWNFAEFTAIPCVLINGVPIFRFHASVCLLSIGAHGTSCAWWPQPLLASWQVFGKEQLQPTPPFASLLSWTIAGAFPLASGSAEGSFRNVLALSHESTSVRDKDKQRAGYQSYVTLDMSRLRSCDNEVRVVHRSNNFLGWVFFSVLVFVLLWFLFCCLFVVFSFFLSYSVSILSQFRKEVSPNMGQKILSAEGQVNKELPIYLRLCLWMRRRIESTVDQALTSVTAIKPLGTCKWGDWCRTGWVLFEFIKP